MVWHEGSDHSGFVLPVGNHLSQVSALVLRAGPAPARHLLEGLLLGSEIPAHPPGLSVLALVLSSLSTPMTLDLPPGLWCCLSLSIWARVLFVTGWGYSACRAGSPVLIPWFVWHWECMRWFWDHTFLARWLPGEQSPGRWCCRILRRRNRMDPATGILEGW